jgi:hypothetical protein
LKKKNFHTYKTRFFSFIWTPPTFKAHNFLIFFFILNDLKWYRSATLSSTNYLSTKITIEQHKRKFLGV